MRATRISPCLGVFLHVKRKDFYTLNLYHILQCLRNYLDLQFMIARSAKNQYKDVEIMPAWAKGGGQRTLG